MFKWFGVVILAPALLLTSAVPAQASGLTKPEMYQASLAELKLFSTT